MSHTVRYLNAAGAVLQDDSVAGDFEHALSHADQNRPGGAIEQRIYDGDGHMVIRQSITGGHYTGAWSNGGQAGPDMTL